MISIVKVKQQHQPQPQYQHLCQLKTLYKANYLKKNKQTNKQTHVLDSHCLMKVFSLNYKKMHASQSLFDNNHLLNQKKKNYVGDNLTLFIDMMFHLKKINNKKKHNSWLL